MDVIKTNEGYFCRKHPDVLTLVGACWKCDFNDWREKQVHDKEFE